MAENSPLNPSPQSQPSEIDPIPNKPQKIQLPSTDSELGYDVSEKRSSLDCISEVSGKINEQSDEVLKEKSSLDCVNEVSGVQCNEILNLDDNKVSGIQLEQNNEILKGFSVEDGLNVDDVSAVDNMNNRVSGISRVFDQVSADNNRVSGISRVSDDVSADSNKVSGIQLNQDEISEFLELKDEVNVIKRENSSEIVLVGSSESQSNEITYSTSKSKMLDGNSNDVVVTMTMELVDETVVVNDCGVGKKSRRRGKKGNSNGMRKLKYARKELEKLRFVNVKSQKKFWKEVYYGFDESVRKEYDELGCFKQNNGQAAGKRNKGYQGNLGDSSTKMTDVKYEENLVEWSEVDDESEDEYFSIQRPAFMVEGEPDFESGSPEDGFEYLRRVRWEAAHIPKVKVVKPDTTKLSEQSVYMPNIPDIEKCPPHLVPLKLWEDEFIAEFSELRLVISSLGETNDATSEDSNTIVFNHPESSKRTSKSQASLELPKGEPNLSTLLAMDPVTRVGLLNKRIKLFESASSLSKDDCGWIFALCAVVETPLDADTCASLRCLLRRCAKLRDEKDEVDDEVVMLNILVTIAGRIFRQSEY